MFKIKLAAFAAIILALGAVSTSAQQATQAGLGAALPDGKIAVVNTQAFPQAIGELKQKYDQVEKQFQPRYQQLQTMENQLKQMENEIQTKCPQMAADKCQDLQRNYEDLKKKATRDYEDAKADYDRTIEATTKPVRDKLFQFLNTYAAQRGIVLVINLAGAAQTGSLAYWNPGTDITDDFVAQYNKANPVPGTAAAPAQQPAQPPKKP
ncbi:MAG TPA: OmpH family outer membrane protein [Blastocatellia bacterium]|nr:OmpH family outer membrane protein [Blastocatellia bacterium]